MIKAIETKYNGYLFRSRTEAKWAYFFNKLGVEYQYENEGYQLSNGDWYLPDFYLPKHDLFIEIKGAEPSQQEFDKCTYLADGLDKIVIMAIGSPDNFNALTFYGYRVPKCGSDKYFYDYYYTNNIGNDSFVGHGIEAGFDHDVSGAQNQRIDKINKLRHSHSKSRDFRFILPDCIKGVVFKDYQKIIGLHDDYSYLLSIAESTKSYRF